jgi:hypothetical protein
MNILRVNVQVLYYHTAEHKLKKKTLFEEFIIVADEATF